MSTTPYSLSAVNLGPTLGRTREMTRIVSALTKPTPDHLTIVGPKRFGKTMVLRATVAVLSDPKKGYVGAGYWDLRHDRPESDASFRSKLATHLKHALVANRPDFAALLDPNDPAGLGLQMVVDELAKTKERVLLVLDGFDHAPIGDGLSVNLLGQLRQLADGPALRFVTGSRAKLREVCRTVAAQESDFWNIFNPNPIEIGRFDDGDWDDLLRPCVEAGLTVEAPAKTELKNWTNGVPLLTLALLGELYAASATRGSITKEMVDNTAAEALASHSTILDDLWDGCSSELRDDLRAASHTDGCPSSQIPQVRRRDLLSRGFIVETSGRVRLGCRVWQSFVEQQAKSVEEVDRLFSDVTRFDRNMRRVLELRLDGLRGTVSVGLESAVRAAIQDLASDPGVSIGRGRLVLDRALSEVAKLENIQGDAIPASWLSEWKSSGRTFTGIMDEALRTGKFPAKPKAILAVLRTATGDVGARRVAKFLSKATSNLLDFVAAVGDFAQHPEGEEVEPGFANAFCFASVELCASIASDLQAAATPAASSPAGGRV